MIHLAVVHTYLAHDYVATTLDMYYTCNYTTNKLVIVVCSRMQGVCTTYISLSVTIHVHRIVKYSLVPRPSQGGREGLVRTVCTCALISRHSGNSVLRMDNSMFQRHYLILSGLLLGSLWEREYSQYTSTEK